MNCPIYNFYKCVTHHPQYLPNAKIFIGYAENYSGLANQIWRKFNEFNWQLQVSHCLLASSNLTPIKEALSECDLFILFYNSDYQQKLGRPFFIQQILPELKQFWQKSCVFKDYGDYFAEAFGACPEQQQALNNQLIAIAASSNKILYRDELGSELEVNIQNAKWTSICGCGNRDLVPGEIATIGAVNGIVKFTGTFLSVVPLALKYGMLDTPLTLTIDNNVIVEVSADDAQLVQDFQRYLQHTPSNSRVEEVGIGTNHAVKLHGINAGFEERHIGLHLGLGGAMPKSDHLDLIFQGGSLAFDKTDIIKNEIITVNA